MAVLKILRSRMRRFAKITALIVALGIMATVLAVLLGFTVASYWEFEGQTSRDIGTGMQASIWVNTNWKSISPLGVRLVTWSTMPYALSISFYSNAPVSNLTTAIVETVMIHYNYGTSHVVLDANKPCANSFTRHRYSNWSSGALQYYEVSRANFILTNCIERNEPLTVVVKGKIMYDKGVAEPFDMKWEFVPKKVSGVFRGRFFTRPIDPP